MKYADGKTLRASPIERQESERLSRRPGHGRWPGLFRSSITAAPLRIFDCVLGHAIRLASRFIWNETGTRGDATFRKSFANLKLSMAERVGFEPDRTVWIL
jgi:hypothetical protein